MEIKINFDQLFEAPNQLNTTQSTSSNHSDHSFQTLSSSFDYQLSFDPQIFQPQTSYFHQQSPQSNKGQYSPNSSNQSNKASSNGLFKKPGERLYYESQANLQRKKKEQQRTEKQKVAALKMIPFAPAINQKSRKMAEKREVYKAEKEKKEVKTTQQIREQQEMKKCTFKPKTNKGGRPDVKSREQLFYILHNTSKIKELKMTQRIEQEIRKQKEFQRKNPDAHFSEFLKRNQEYAEVTRKKQELMKISVQNYDLKTGEKLFSPKISQIRTPIKSTAPVENKNGIFKKKQNISRNKDYQFYQQNHQDEYNTKYRQYSQEYDRQRKQKRQRISKDILGKTGKQIIVQESEKDVGKFDDDGQFQPQSQNLWNSLQGSRQFQQSKVRHFMAGSEEDQPEPKNNYVMDILSNLIHLKQEGDQE